MSDKERLVRGTVTASHGEQKLRTLQVLLQAYEPRDNLEHIEPYGFTSEPHCDKSTDALVGFLDDTRSLGFVINVADRRYRITKMKSGEVAIYDDLKRHIYFKRDGIEINGADSPITVKTTNSLIAEVGKDATVTASGNITLTSNADISITAKGTLFLKGGQKTIISSSDLEIN